MCLEELAFFFGKAGWRSTQAGAECDLHMSGVSLTRTLKSSQSRKPALTSVYQIAWHMGWSLDN